jgi:multisubunit Na+/H+ antiporter MnhE subunit
MLHAAAMLTGLFLIWLALTSRGFSLVELGVAAGVAFTCLLVAWRFGGVGRGFARAPILIVLRGSRAGAVVRGAVQTVRAALAADVALKPALVRVKSRVTGQGARAALAEMISAAPGQVVVEADADGLLLHVNDEDGVDAAELGALEARVLAAVRQEAPA